MKTTLHLDDDIAAFLQEQSRLHSKPFEQVVNDTLRAGMTHTAKRADAAPFRVKPNNSGFIKDVEQVRLNQLLADMDVENYLAGNEANTTSPSPNQMSLEAAYGSVEPANKPENFNEITATAKQAKAEETARKLNHA